MGLFSVKRKTLSKEIFLDNNRIKPSVQEIILTKLAEYVPTQLLHSVWLVGSMLGFRYEPDSDLDVQVQLNNKDSVSLYSAMLKEFNRSGENYLIGKHPVNFFVLPKIETVDYSNLTGAYDLINMKWIKRSVEQPQGFDQRLVIDGPYLGMLKREMARQIDQVKREPTFAQAKDVAALYEKVDAERKLAYGFGLGTPRYTPANIQYKSLEHEFKNVPESIYHLVRKVMQNT